MSEEKKDKTLIKGVAWLDPSLDKPDLPVEMDLLWNQYQASGDTECLAKAAEIVPFFGKPEIGQEIAKLLRDKHSTKKLERAIQWSEIYFMFEAFSAAGFKKEDIYVRLAEYKGIDPESMKRELMRRKKE